jgi:aquaporin Z
MGSLEELPMPQEIKSENILSEVPVSKKIFAELIGTMVLVLMGCGSAVFSAFTNSPIGTVGISFAFGFSLLAMVYAIGGISGCHINPAVTIAMLLSGKIKIKESGYYILAQSLGAVLGASVLYFIVSGNASFSLATTGLGANVSTAFSLPAVFMAELVFTFIFILVILGSTSERAPKGFAGISIGLSLALIHLVSIPIDGTSVNPARSLGPALFVGGTALNQLWIFIAAPIIGGILAAMVWRALK